MKHLISSVFFLPSFIFAHFQVIVLGCSGGPGETNNSAYLVGAQSSNDFIAFDAGTILHGLEIAVEKGAFTKINKNPVSPWSLTGEILRNHIHAYLISHPHLDHVAGLIINSTCDSKKPIYALNATIDAIRDHLFNGIIWPNFGSEGNLPILHQYDYKRVKEKEPFLIPNMQMQGQAFVLSHPDGYVSTAFLIKHEEYYILYCGDTAPDSLEKQKNL
ncbi:MAG: 3',5'-cyclic-nucleotide phosphodiesterase, partial [Chlamydiae bacterium]|nr:3',5'-cyclic-nucleotide phosphodiesterase [Chlamydiota bacterium]